MKIADVRTMVLLCPLEETFHTSGAAMSSIGDVLEERSTDDGLQGLGDCHVYMGSQHRVGEIMNEALNPLILGRNPFDIESIWESMFTITWQNVRSRNGWRPRDVMAAIAGVDIALWDIIGKATGQPVYNLLGGLCNPVQAYASGGYYQDDRGTDDLVKEMVSYVEDLGYRAVKMKVGGLSPHEDIERVKAVREAVGSEIDLMVDANQAWDVPTAIDVARALEGCAPLWFEEPVHWYEGVRGLSKVSAAIGIPVAAGENEYTRFGCRELIEREAVGVLQYGCTTGGGITEWRRVAAMASCHGMAIVPHHDPHIHAHVVASSPLGQYVEVFPNAKRDPLWAELFKARPEVKNGVMEIPATPGLGLELNERTVQRFLVESR